uniref:Uncharacterized protein n=1 Tax=Anopheles dirus TaxID=7168 RepID=A0A182NY13_9DIPT
MYLAANSTAATVGASIKRGVVRLGRSLRRCFEQYGDARCRGQPFICLP